MNVTIKKKKELVVGAALEVLRCTPTTQPEIHFNKLVLAIEKQLDEVKE